MRTECLLLLFSILICTGSVAVQAQTPVAGARAQTPSARTRETVDTAVLPILGIPGKEAFIGAIFGTVVDSSFSSWYLCEKAYPCSFVKYDYDEWIKYALQETVPIYILNELAQKSYYDRKPENWRPDDLAGTGARCISEEKATALLDPAGGLPSDTTLTNARRQRIRHRIWQHWSALPAQDRTVFYFSRPLFTDDGQYAILDLDYRCDARQCGAGAVCLFRHTAAGWKLIGKRVRWGG